MTFLNNIKTRLIFCVKLDCQLTDFILHYLILRHSLKLQLTRHTDRLDLEIIEHITGDFNQISPLITDKITNPLRYDMDILHVYSAVHT